MVFRGGKNETKNRKNEREMVADFDLLAPPVFLIWAIFIFVFLQRDFFDLQLQ